MESNSDTASSRRDSDNGDIQQPDQAAIIQEVMNREDVPRYVDMIIPDYDSSTSGRAQQASRDRRPQAQRGERQQGDVAAGRPSEMDVVLNPADGSQFPGNGRYATVVRHLAKRYVKVKSEYHRAAVQILVSAVKAQGGRFLKYGKDGGLKLVSDKTAFGHAGRAIRGTSRRIKVGSSRKKKSRKTAESQLTDGSSVGLDSKGQARVQRMNGDEDSKSSSDQSCDLEMISLRLQTKDESLSHVRLDLQTVDHSQLFPFAKSLDTTTTLTSMEIQLANINQPNADTLAWGLKHCRSLKQIKFVSLQTGKSHSLIILKGAISNPHIESLNIDENGINKELLEQVCDMVMEIQDSSLQRLSLEGNPFGDQGAYLVAGLIDNHKSLRFLNLRGNEIQAPGCLALLEALKRKNRTCLFEISGLEAINHPGPSRDDSTDDSKKKHVPS